MEQIINADAASQRRGIVSLTNSISERQRWAESHFIRTTIVSHLFEKVDLTKKEDVSQELPPSKIEKNAEDVKTLIEVIENAINAFSNDVDKNQLFNIATGKSAAEETKKLLLNVRKSGKSLQEKFIKECNKDPDKFENPISRQKMKTFATELKKVKVRGSNEKTAVSTMMRDLFDSILCVALEKKVDMADILTYPLTPVPLSLCHLDGSMQKTQKTKLLQELEKRVKSTSPSHIDVTIIDAMFFLHLLFDLPQTFGQIATVILKRVCNVKSRVIHLVFDEVISPSIKDCERDSRSDCRDESVSNYWSWSKMASKLVECFTK